MGEPAGLVHRAPRPELITRRSAVTPTGENPQSILPAWFNGPTITPINKTTTTGLSLAPPRTLASVPPAAPRQPTTAVLPHWFQAQLPASDGDATPQRSMAAESRPVAALLPGWFSGRATMPDDDEPLANSQQPSAILPDWFSEAIDTAWPNAVNPESEFVNPLPAWFASPPLRPLADCTPSADLDLQLIVPNPASIGDPQGDEYIIQATNNSAVSTTTDIQFEIDPPAGFFYAGNSASGFSTSDGSLSFTSQSTTTPGLPFNLELSGSTDQQSLSPGEIIFVSFRMLANGSAVSGSALTVALRSASPAAQCDVVTENVPVVKGKVAISKVPASPAAGRGDTVQWTILVSNTGDGPVYDAALSDTASAAFTNTTFSPSITPLFTLAPGAVRSYLVESTLNAPTNVDGSPPDNYASVLWPQTSIFGYAPYIESVSTTSQIDYVVPAVCVKKIDLRMTLIPPPNPVNRGDVAGEVYTVTIRNRSTLVSSEEVSLWVNPNAGFYFKGGDAQIVSSIDGEISAISPLSDTIPGAAFTLTIWGDVSAATLAPGEIMTFTFRLATNEDAQSGQLLETALRSGSPVPVSCQTAQQNIPTVRGNLVIIKDPPVQVAEVGDTVTWTVKLRNTGLGEIYDAEFADTIGSGYTNVVIPVSTTVDILPEDEVTYTVSGMINACGNLTNTVAAWWSIGNADGTGVITTPVDDQVDVILELIDPDIDIQIGALPQIGYCDPVDAVIPITVTNNGGPGRNLNIENLSTGGLSVSLETAPNWTTRTSGNFFDYIPDIFPSTSVETFTVRVQRADVCAVTPVALSFRSRHQDACELLQVIDTASTVTATLGTDAPTLNINKTGPSVIVVGGEYTYTINVFGDNRENIGPAGLFITDTLPSQIEVLDIGSTNGTPVRNGTQISWQPDVTDTGTGAYSETMTIRYRVPLTYNCGAGGEISNRVDALAATLCPQCAPLQDSDILISYIEDPVVGAFNTTVSSPNIDVCAPPGDPFTVTSVLEARNGITWAGSIYYSEEIFDAFKIVSGSIKVVIDGVDRTSDVTVTEGISLVIKFDNIGTYSNSAIITITYGITAHSSIVSANPGVTHFIFTAFSYGGISDNACGLGGIAFAGEFITVNRGNLSVSVSPDAIETCRVNNVTVRVTNDNPSYVANNLVVTFTADSADIITPSAVTYGGEFSGTPPTSVISSVVGSQQIITFIFPTDFSLANEGTINLPLFRPCGKDEPLRAGVSFADQCSVPYNSSGSGGNQTLQGDVTLFVSPNEYKVPDREAQYQFYVSNNGDASAVNLVVTNSLPLGYLYDSFAVSGNSQVPGSALSAISVVTAAVAGRTLITFNIPSLPVGGRLNFSVNILADSCTDPAIVKIALPESCNQINGSCTARQDAQVKFTKGFPSLLSSNDQEANLKLCGTGPVNLVIKNTSAQASLYNYSITEILTNVTILTDSAVVTVTDGKGNILTGVTSGQPLAGIPFTPAASISVFGGDFREMLYWSLTNTGFISGTPQFDVLAKRRASEIINISFLVQSGCAGLEALVASEGQAEDICGVVLGFSEDSISLIVDAPEVIVGKTGKLVSDTTFSEKVYANAGDEVVWQLNVENIGTEAANTLNVKDILPPSFVVDPVTGVDPPATLITSTSGLTTLIWSYTDTNTPLQPETGRLFYITGTFLGDTCASTQTNKVEVNFGCSADDAECLSAPVADAATLDTQPDLALSSDADLSACNGTITITVDNDGPPAYNVIITDILPSGYVWDGGATVSSTVPTSFTLVGTNTLEWRWAGTNTLPTGASTLAFRVINNKTGGVCNAPATVQNRILAEYDNTCGDAPFGSAQTDTLTVETPQLQVTKTPGQISANVGEEIVWTISITNVGSVLATDIAVTDTAASGFSNVSASSGSGGEQPFTSTVLGQTVITWAPHLTIPVGGSWQAQVTATVESVGIQRNQIDVKGSCLEGCSYGAEVDIAYVTLFSEFDKGPTLQTGTIGSLTVFTFTATLPDGSALYEDLIITDTLPAGLGYIDSYLSYVYSGSGSISVISNTPTVTPGYNNNGNVVWRLGSLSGTVRFSGTITAVVQNISGNRDGSRRVNQMNVTYSDDGQDYQFTDSASVDIYEPVLHLGKSYVTTGGCGATLYHENFNSNTATGWVTDGGGVWAASNGLYQYSGDGSNRRAIYSGGVFTDFSTSAILRSTDSNAHMGLLFRVQNLTNTYRLRWGGTGVPAPSDGNPDQRGLRLERIVGGFALPIVSTSAVRYNPGTWYHVEVRAVGNRLEVYIDGLLRLSATNSGYSSGGLGLYTNDNTLAQFDDLLTTRLGQSGCFAGAGDTVTYTLTISNQRTLPGYDLVVTDILPDGLNLATYTLSSNDPANPAFTFEPVLGSGGVITWGIDHLTPTVPFDPLAHTALTLTVVLTVSPDITANIVLPNQATLTYDNWLTDTNPTTISRTYSGGSHSTAIRSVGAVAPVSKTVRFSPPPTVTLGSLVTYTLLVPGAPISATLRNIVITDQLNAPRFYIESVTVSGGVSPTTGFSQVTGLITATFGQIPAYAQALVTVTTRVSYEYPSTSTFPVSGNVITNNFVMIHATANAITRSNVVSVQVGEPNLNLTKIAQSSTGSLANLDGAALLTYVLRITNSGSSPAYSINITDALPTGVSVTQIFNGGVLQSDSTLSWTIDSLSNTVPANTAAVSYTAILSQVAAGSVLTNTANVLYHSLTETISGVRPYTDATAAAISTARIRTAKTVQRSSGLTDNLRIGDGVTYTVVVTVPPATIIYWPQLVDALPPGFRFISTTTRGLTVTSSASIAGGALLPPPLTGTLGSGVSQREVITWNLSSVSNTSQSAAGVISTVFAAQITGLTPAGSEAPPRSQQLNSVAAVNVVTVAWNITDTGSFSPALALTETDTATSTVGQPQLNIAKTSDPASGEIVATSQLITYFLTLTNSGRTPAYNVIVTDTLPAGINYLSSTILPATVPLTRHQTLSATGVISWEVGVIGGLDDPRWLGLGRVVTIVVVARVDAAIGANLTLTNSAAIPYYDSMPDGGTGPISPTQRTYTNGSDNVFHLTVQASLAKSVVPATATLGSVITYVIAVPQPTIAANLYNVTVTDRLDSRLALQAVNAPGADGSTVKDNAFTVTVSLIQSNTQRLITVTAILSSDLLAVDGDVITNQAVMTHSGGSTVSNRTAFTVTEPGPVVTKEVSITADPQVALYTVTVANTGTSTLYDVGIIDTPPQGISVTNISGSGQVIAAGRLISWTIAAIPAGGQTVLTYNGVLTGEIYSGRRFTNTVVVTGTSLGRAVSGVRLYTDTTSAGIDWPLGRIGDTVWLDQNYDGIQNEDFATYGISGVLVELFNSTSGSRLATTTTSITGFYSFDNLPLGITYTVRLAPENFGQTGVLSDFAPTRLNVGSVLSDSGADPDAIFSGSGYAITTTVLARSAVSTEDLSLDYGFVPAMALGNRVWFDTNDDGRLNNGEPGIGGVTVELYRDTNGDGRYTPGIDARQATTTTNTSGNYTFTRLLPSFYPTETYLVIITGSNFIGAGSLVNHITSSVAYTSNNDIGRDNLNHGTLTGPLGNGGFVASTVITLAAGLAPHAAGRANYTIDFGFLRADLGDLPDSYGTVITSSGPRHVISPTNNPTLGATVDAESDGQPSADARGDDDNIRYGSGPDDEDGVTWTPFILDQTSTFTISASVTGAFLNGWVDWNADGVFDEATEKVISATQLTAVNTNFNIYVPLTATLTGSVGLRFRYSTTPTLAATGPAPNGFAPNGEVEDYITTTLAYDWGDLPDGPYSTTLLHDGPHHVISPGFFLGNRVDAEGDGQPNATASGDDSNATPASGAGSGDDEDGVSWTPLAKDQASTFVITASRGGGYLNGWIDWNGDGDFDNGGEHVFAPTQTLSAGPNSFSVTIPLTVTGGNIYMRFRFSTSSTLTPTGPAPDGEVEDYVATAVAYDLGDLPLGYNTVLAESAAYHQIDGTYLGSRVDTEGDGQPVATADGDDNNATPSTGNPTPGNDEDGVVFLTPIMPGRLAVISVTAGTGGYLNSWFDFDGNGTLDDFTLTGINGTPVTSQSNGDIFLNGPGTYLITFTVPGALTDTLTTSLYSRFRFTTNPAEATTPAGFAPSGEVEDYVLLSLGDFVWLDDGVGGGSANNGRLDGAEQPLGNVVLRLLDGGGSPLLDGDGNQITTTTNTNGRYRFTGLTPGDYHVEVISSNFTAGPVPGPLVGLLSSSGAGAPNSNSDEPADENGRDNPNPESNGIRSDSITLLAGTEPLTDGTNDANANFTLDFGFAPLLSLGNQVWFDTNNNGLFDVGTEPVLSNVVVELYRDTNGDGRYTPGIDARQAATTTNASGTYTFTQLSPGGYVVVIPGTNFNSGGTLAGYITSTIAVTGNSDLDNHNHGLLTGTPGSGGYVAGTVVTLTTGLEPNDTGRANYTIDFGFVRYDWGDLPDSYGTVITSSGPRHVILPAGNPTLGADVDAEPDGLPAADARGDDDDNRDDEDGVRLDSPLVAGKVATFAVTGTNVAGAVLNVWVDWNGDGVFDAGERVFTATPLVAGPQPLTATVPAAGLSTTINTRWRYSTDISGSGSPTGTALSGEVEDHQYRRQLPALEMAKVLLSDSPVLAGDLITFAIFITNTGGTALATVPLTDTYDPSVLGFAGAAPPASSSEPFAGRVSWNNVGPVPPGGSITVTIVFTALRAITVTTNTARTAAVDNLTQPTPPATDTATVSINPRTDLALSKASRPRPLLPGAAITYTLVVSNLGPSPVTVLILTDNLPLPVQSPVYTWRDGSYNSSTGVWSGLNMSAGDQVVLTISGRLAPDFTGQLQNTAVVTPGDGTDDNTSNNVATDTNIVLTPSIAVDKLVNVTPNVDLSVVAATVTYTLRMTNSGQVTFTALRITDTLPTGFAYVAGTSRGDGSPLNDPAVQPGGELVWYLPTTTLLPGQHYDLTFAALISLPRGTTGTFRNSFTGSGIYTNGQVTGTDSVDVVVTDPRVAITKTLVSAVAGVLTFSIEVRNTGPSTLAQVPLIDDWVGPLAFLSATPPPDSVITGVNSGRTFWSDLTRQATPPFDQAGRDLAPGESFFVTAAFSVTVPALTIAFTNTAVVSDAEDSYANRANDDTDQVARNNQPTPITLNYFRGVQQLNSIRLEWETAAEIDNFGFQLRRSSTGALTDAVEVAFVPAAGGKFSGATYAYTDTSVLSGTTYTYWLVDVDTNFTEIVHSSVTIAFTGGVNGETNVGNSRTYLPVILKED